MIGESSIVCERRVGNFVVMGSIAERPFSMHYTPFRDSIIVVKKVISPLVVCYCNSSPAAQLHTQSSIPHDQYIWAPRLSSQCKLGLSPKRISMVLELRWFFILRPSAPLQWGFICKWSFIPILRWLSVLSKVQVSICKWGSISILSSRLKLERSFTLTLERSFILQLQRSFTLLSQFKQVSQFL